MQQFGRIIEWWEQPWRRRWWCCLQNVQDPQDKTDREMWRLGQCDICDKYIYPKCYDRDISAIDSFSCSICINIKVRLPFNYPFGHLIMQSIHLYVHLSAWLVSMKFCLKGNFFPSRIYLFKSKSTKKT